MRFSYRLLTTLTLSLAFASGGASAASLEAYAFSVSAQSGVGTYGAPTYLSSNYSGGISGKTYPLYDQLAAASEDSSAGAIGPQTATSSASSLNNNSANGLWSSTSSSSSTASYGSLGVAASTSATGSGDANTLRGAVAYAESTETFTVTGGTGSALFWATYTVDGSWTSNGANLDLELTYSVNNGPGGIAYRIQAAGSPSIYFNQGFPYPGGYVGSLPGLSVTSNSVTGSTEISFWVAFNFGTAFDLTTALYAGAVPGGSTSGTIDFLSTARLTGISITQGGNPVTSFDINSGSGTLYTAQGAVVPVPAAVWMFGSALGLLGLARRRA